ncbi:unnamed protein product [Prorocentrum cordatum]|uniref:Uncharacterized protein n=1 Tax=Prorocentrum cordatum TaxID=2364126 RepID=A0ABN9W156_9DINO|nr:unnamed protein product [Polarella glacialis]|eukprot:6576269-Pyramimonas_sp.AAC.4
MHSPGVGSSSQPSAARAIASIDEGPPKVPKGAHPSDATQGRQAAGQSPRQPPRPPPPPPESVQTILETFREQVAAQTRQNEAFIAAFHTMNEQNQQNFQALQQAILQVASHRDVGGATGGTATPEAAQGNVGSNTFFKSFPASLNKSLDKVTYDFEQNLGKSVKAKAMHAKAVEDVKLLAQGSYPNGMRPFKSPAHHVELDAPWSTAASTDVSVALPSGQLCTIPKGFTRREAKAALHRWVAHELRAIDVEALESSSANAAEMSKKSVFAKTCEDIMDKACSSQASDLGLEEPLMKQVSPEMRAEKVEELYRRAVLKVEKTEASKRDALEKHRRAEEQKEQQLLQTKPESLFQNAVEHIAEAAVQKAMAAQDSMVVEDLPGTGGATAGHEHTAKFVEALAKNGGPPGGARGKQQTASRSTPPKPQGAGRGKGKGKPKGGKGKGYGKKGKGKRGKK